jgi:hypothetical protein
MTRKIWVFVISPLLVLLTFAGLIVSNGSSNALIANQITAPTKVGYFTQSVVIMFPNGTAVHESFHGTDTFTHVNGLWIETSMNGLRVDYNLVAPDSSTHTNGATGNYTVVDPDLEGQVTMTGLTANTFYQATVCFVSGCTAPFTGAIPIVIGTGIFANGYTGHIEYPNSAPSVPVSHSAFSWIQETDPNGNFFLNWRACC